MNRSSDSVLRALVTRRSAWLLLCASCGACGASESQRPTQAPPLSDVPSATVERGQPPSAGEGVAARTTMPEPLGTAVRFPPGWRGPCRVVDRYGGRERVETYEYDRTGGCLVPVFALTDGTFGCPASNGLADDPPDRRRAFSYDGEGRMTSDGMHAFRWDGDRLVGMDRGEVSIDRVVVGEVTLATAEVRVGGETSRETNLDGSGLPIRDRHINWVNGSEFSASALDYEAGRLVRIELVFPGMRHEMTFDYCE